MDDEDVDGLDVDGPGEPIATPSVRTSPPPHPLSVLLCISPHLTIVFSRCC